MFIRTQVTLTIFSEDEIPFGADLGDILREADTGDYVMSESRKPGEQLTGAEMARALTEAGSDPEFFQLDNDGNRIED